MLAEDPTVSMMALESVNATEAIIPSNDNDLEDGEIASDEEDEPAVAAEVQIVNSDPSKSPSKKVDEKSQDEKLKQVKKTDRSKTKDLSSEDWAGDVEKALKTALKDDKSKNHDYKSKNKNNKNRSRKRSHDNGKDDDRSKDPKKKKMSDDEIQHDDDDEMLFVRGASPVKKEENSPNRRLDREMSPPYRRMEHDNYDSGSDFEDRILGNRHRDEKRGGPRWQKHQERKKASGAASRRNAKERNANSGNSNKSRSQMRNDRQGRRNQVHDQDPDSICVFYMQGKCHRDDCPYSHDALPPRKMELCKFYLMDCCAKRDKCLYMHHDFPCKFFHTGMKCNAGDECKFSHEPMSEQVRNILLKHLETAPKEILGNFPRLSRESAIYMMNNTEKLFAQQNAASKIPSLFEVKVSNDISTTDAARDEEDRDRQARERKSHSKKTRWGSNDDRVSMDHIVKAQMNQKDIPAPNFYVENTAAEKPTENKDKPPQETKPKEFLSAKDVDLRQIIGRPLEASQSKSLETKDATEPTKNFSKLKLNEESDREDDSRLVIATDDDNMATDSSTASISNKTANLTNPDVPENLPKHVQELYLRIQQQQREAVDSYKNLENSNNHGVSHVGSWYSEDEDDDDDDDENQLKIVLNDVSREDEEEDIEEKEEKEDQKEKEEYSSLLPALIPDPATVNANMDDVKKIDISSHVHQLLSSLKAQKANKIEDYSPIPKPEPTPSINHFGSLPATTTTTTTAAAAATTTLSRDPRMSRDPRQRRDEPRIVVSTPNVPIAPPKSEDANTARSLVNIYSSGIINQDRSDSDPRRKDMDLRCFPTPVYGDTDLRIGVHTSESGDVDLRAILPYKPPKHDNADCVEVDGSIETHGEMDYILHTIDIPRADYSGLMLTRSDPQVRYDPRLQKIFGVTKEELDSPMSPPPMRIADTPRSPPPVRVDPRLRAMESQAPQPKIIPTTVQQHGLAMPDQHVQNMSMRVSPPYMQVPNNMQPMMQQQSMGPPSLMMQTPNPMMGNMSTMMCDGPMMGGNPNMRMDARMMDRMDDRMVDRMGERMMDRMPDRMMDRMPDRMMDRMPDRMMDRMPPGNRPQPQNQYDARYNPQRGPSVGLLGVAPPPQGMAPYQDPRPQFDGPPQRGYMNDGYGDVRNYNKGNRGMGYDNQPDWNGRPNRKDKKRGNRGKFGALPRKKDN